MQPQVFVLTPFDSDGQQVRDAVRRAIEEIGFGVVQYKDSIRPGSELTLSIFDGFREADLIIADVSNLDPNVMYELGFAEALRKPVILLVSIKSSTGLAGVLTSFRFILYDPANLRDLADAVKAETKAIRLRRSALLSA